MNKSDDQLTIAEYWDRHKFDIADMRGWDCKKEGCSQQSNECEKCCHCIEEREERGTTLRSYGKFIERMKPFLTSPISETSAFEVMDALKSVQKNRKDGKPYTDSTMKSYLSCLCDIFLFAKKHGHANNVLAVFASGKKMDPLAKRIYSMVSSKTPETELAALQEETSDRPRSLTIWQREKLMKAIDNDTLNDGRAIGTAIICYAGTRPAECRKLFWKDVVPFIDHPERSFLNVFDIRAANGELLEKTKTENGHRKIPVHYELQKLLSKRLELVRAEHPHDYLDMPVCCVGNAFDQPCKDYHLANYADELFSGIKVSNNDLACYYLDATIERRGKWKDSIYDGEALCLYVLRKNFWTWMEAETQLTDHEKRYVMGHTIKDEKQKSIRGEMNDENLIWDICEKMDRFVFCVALHADLLEYELHPEKQVVFSNQGMISINLSPKVLEKGGDILIECRTEDVNDVIIYETPNAITPLKSMKAMVFPIPCSSHDRTGLNCQYENILAHKKPAAPLRKPDQGNDS